MDLNAFAESAVATLIAVGWKVAGAIALWLVGRWLIGFALRLIGRATAKQQFDVTLWQVYFDTNRLIRETFGEAGFPPPMPSYAVSGVFPNTPVGAGR